MAIACYKYAFNIYMTSHSFRPFIIDLLSLWWFEFKLKFVFYEKNLLFNETKWVLRRSRCYSLKRNKIFCTQKHRPNRQTQTLVSNIKIERKKISQLLGESVTRQKTSFRLCLAQVWKNVGFNFWGHSKMLFEILTFNQCAFESTQKMKLLFLSIRSMGLAFDVPFIMINIMIELT